MLNLRVPLAITYVPRIFNNKRLPCGFIEKVNQDYYRCTINNGNFSMVSFHQKLNGTYQCSLNERQMLIKTYGTSTDLLKEKRLHQKIAKKFKHITSSKLETDDSKHTKIPIHSEPEVADGTVNEINIKTIETNSTNLDKNVLMETSSSIPAVASKTDILEDILTGNSQPVMSKKNSQSEQVKTKLLLSSHEIKYVDLSSVTVPIPLHENDNNLFESGMEESLDKIRYYKYQAEDSYLKVHERGKIWYITVEEKLNSSVIYQELLKGNITIQPITNRISILLAEKDPDKKVEKTVEKVKETSKSVAKIICDKSKDLWAYIKDLIEKNKAKK